MFEYKLLKEKEKLLDNACNVLKSEFIGLDEIIDSIIYNVKPWFLFPELQNRPHVVCLWGLTGTGKTSLVKRLCQLLNIEKDMIYFNFAEIGECSSWEIEDKIETELASESSNRVFVYDEFQYAATLDNMGNEKDKKSGLKPFWELLDDGKLHRRDSFWRVHGLFKVVNYMTKINLVCPIELKDGVWINSEKCLLNFNKYDISEFRKVFNFGDEIKKESTTTPSTTEYAESDGLCVMGSGESCYDNPNNLFLKYEYIDRLMDFYEKVKSTIADRLELYHKIKSFSFDELYTFIVDIFDSARKGYYLNFAESIIFVIGNLDEAYTIAFNSDPDMSPDQFNKITKKITVVDIKEALQKRFRNEQIARLGNVHLIYPAFSSKSFKEIIKLSLDKYKDDVKGLTGYNLKYNESLVNFIYDESVFPTHGTRPIFSSIHEIVKSKLPLIMRELYEKNIDADTFEFSYRNRKLVIDILNKKSEKVYTIKYTEKTRINNLRESKCDEEQAIVAVHESGHFAIYAALMHKIPEKLCSKTASSNTGGFLMQDFDDNHKLQSYDMLINKIKITLGGYCAERMVFGDKCMSIGASSDLKNATITASELVRNYGMFYPFVTTYSTNPDVNVNGLIVMPDTRDSTNNKIISIIDECMKDVYMILDSECFRLLLKESSEYLSVNSHMPKKKMQELYDRVCEGCKIKKKDSEYYRKKIEEITI